MQEGLPAGCRPPAAAPHLPAGLGKTDAGLQQTAAEACFQLRFASDGRPCAEDTARFAFPAPLSCASARRGRAAVALAASSSAWPSFTGRRRTMREQREMNGDPARRIAAGCSRLSPLGKRRCVAKDFLQAGFSCLQANLHPFA